MHGESNASDLLINFEQILESDPAFDEVGFVHPSQFVNLSEEASSSLDSVVFLKDGSAVFWNREHKLGISTDVLISLYKEAKRALMGVILSCAPKSEHAWCHRRWVIKLIAGKFSSLDEIATKESELVEKIAEVYIQLRNCAQ